MLSKIKAHNFLSFEYLEVDIPLGVTLIDGWNADDDTSEGSGKSAILNAVCWTVYGKLPKDAKIDDVIRTGQKEVSVSITFDNGDMVYRKRKSSSNDLYIVQDGNELRGKDAKETQEQINEFVGMSYETFCQTIYFAQNYPKKFITSNQEDKLKILSEVLNLTDFDRARDVAKKEAKELKQTIESAEHKHQLLLRDVEVNNQKVLTEQTKIDAIKAAHETNIQTVEAGLIGLEKEIEADTARLGELIIAVNTTHDINVDQAIKYKEALQIELHKYATDLENVTTLQATKDQKNSSGVMYAKKYQTIEAKIVELREFIANPTDKECPVCKSSLGTQDTSHAATQIQEHEAELEEITTMLTQLRTEIDAMGDISAGNLQEQVERVTNEIATHDIEIQKAESINQQKTRDQATIDALNTQLTAKKVQRDSGDASLKALRASPPSVDETQLTLLGVEAKNLTQAISDVTEHKDELRIKLARYETLKSGFKELKLHALNSFLTELNLGANNYLQSLFEVSASLKFANEDTKITTEVILDEQERGLGLLSGGQFRRFSLAVDLALSDIILSRVNSKFGVTFWDEYMKDLSENSMNKVLELFKVRKEPTILIEHNSIFKSIVGNTLNVTLENGVSRLEE